ncbi:uncharacterized protein PGTG_01790 [Puccinia graminis f. sp. tritici CRL 75-36-700-3]|uniref:Uncharacterized protein n=1 Tax=Puccinia graminis f. sp. tritici (strain CRL 75-36-700-3 / race SCCL) TaxID=418459 RepID=E3JTC3_PUCGT|nr:uncharacterized protein PGTG_01790 [Puccinia graminis f. sp. tritici CRL 75-36-700-3]EFP75197.1 hypothetical protein PGTG_01790 [Puccinia graminis f. sp. tritici CRL 75-36-700-3]
MPTSYRSIDFRLSLRSSNYPPDFGVIYAEAYRLQGQERPCGAPPPLCGACRVSAGVRRRRPHVGLDLRALFSQRASKQFGTANMLYNGCTFMTRRSRKARGCGHSLREAGITSSIEFVMARRFVVMTSSPPITENQITLSLFHRVSFQSDHLKFEN